MRRWSCYYSTAGNALYLQAMTQHGACDRHLQTVVHKPITSNLLSVLILRADTVAQLIARTYLLDSIGLCCTC